MRDGCEGKIDEKKVRASLPVIASDGAPRSRSRKWRAFALVLLQLLMAAHIIQWQITGRTVSPIEPSETMYTLQNGAINAGMIFFAIAILSTLILGRWVCGWACHVVALQDFCTWLMNKFGIRPRPFRSRLLLFVPISAASYMFVWPVVGRALSKSANEPLIPQFTNHLIVNDFWATFPPWWIAIPFLFICGFVTVYFLGSKGFCTYACPYGGVFVLADKVAPARIRVTDDCNKCGLCTAACTANVQVHTEVDKYGMVIDPGCMKHLDCISACPNDALYFGFGKPSLFAKSPAEKAKPRHQLTWPEEIISAVAFVVSLFAFWDVYQVLVAFLFSLGLAAISSFIILKTWQTLRKAELPFLNWKLKSLGKLTTAGMIFLAFATLWIGLVAHSGFIRFHEWAGAKAFEYIRIPDELALAQADPSVWLTEDDKANVTSGRRHLELATRYGLLTNATAIPRLAWLEYLAGNSERAVQLLGDIAEHQSDQPAAISYYYRSAILNRLGRHAEALQSIDKAISASPNLATAAEEKGEGLWQLGRREEAFETWLAQSQRTPNLPVLNNFVAGAAQALGKPNSALLENRADQTTPRDGHFHVMLALRMENVGMTTLAEKHFKRAYQLNPSLKPRGR